jgi:hypothetical protein
MRFLVKVSMPVEAGNAAAKGGFKAIAEILAEQKPEAVYFYEESGRRTGLLVLHLNDASEIPAVAEPWFLAMNASVEFHPAMTPEDLERAGPAIARAVERHG